MSKFFKNGELDDKKIIKALKHATQDYEDGAILEAKNVLVKIVNAITDFETEQEG